MRPRPISSLERADVSGLKGVFCDIDDTLTLDGQLTAAAYDALWSLHRAGLRVVPVTGRPGGWVDQIARMWPVDGVVGENGGLWFYRRAGKLERHFLQSPADRSANRERLETLATQILEAVPGCALASDQPYRELDLAIDFCEDVPRLPDHQIDAIVDCFRAAGATCKVSSIHVNGWYGQFDKWTGCCRLAQELWGEDLEQTLGSYAYFGDSANDEPMFARFGLSIGVANVEAFLPRMEAWPSWICAGEGGDGFSEGVERLLALR